MREDEWAVASMAAATAMPTPRADADLMLVSIVSGSHLAGIAASGQLARPSSAAVRGWCCRTPKAADHERFFFCGLEALSLSP